MTNTQTGPPPYNFVYLVAIRFAEIADAVHA